MVKHKIPLWRRAAVLQWLLSFPHAVLPGLELSGGLEGVNYRRSFLSENRL